MVNKKKPTIENKIWTLLKGKSAQEIKQIILSIEQTIDIKCKAV